MKTIFNWIIKAFFSGTLAFLVMTVFCVMYYNVPVHYPNDSGATDYSWTPHSFYSRLTEGTAYGKTNNEGFLNSYDYVEGMDVDILVMGSSHVEGFNVAQNESISAKLDELIGDKRVYNIGISGHDFLVCCNNFKAALKRYQPSEYVIIETDRLSFSSEQLDSVLKGTLHEISDHSDGILGLLSKNQFLRLLYEQMKGFMRQSSENGTVAPVSDQPVNAGLNGDKLDQIFSSLRTIALEYGIEIIIFYHPSTQLNTDGNLLLPDDLEICQEFSNLCMKNDITFLDMTGRFQYEYETKHILPHGFINSSVGSGHINKYGHEMIADELYKIIN